MRFPTMPGRWRTTGAALVLIGSALLTACGTAPVSRPVADQLPVCAPASAPAVAEVVAPPKPMRPPRIGLALGGGAARGFAHIGVIEVLE